MKLCETLFAEAITVAREEGIEQLTMRISPRDIDAIQTANSLGFNFIDVLVTYAIDINQIDTAKIQPPKDFIIRMKQDSDFDVLQKIAHDSFVKDRFHSDTKFNKAAADTFHGKWIENSLSGKAADDVVVAEVDGVPAGFTTIKNNRLLSESINLRSGSMILSAVDSSFRGKSLYTHMIAGGLRYFMDKADVVDLGTQVDNLPVQRAWCFLGFKPSEYMVTMHWWDI
jgi:ribosomal protein S18 acetylase RimI-like enzyme